MKIKKEDVSVDNDEEVLFQNNSSNSDLPISNEDNSNMNQERRSNRKRKSSLIVTLSHESMLSKEQAKKKIKEDIVVKEEKKLKNSQNIQKNAQTVSKSTQNAPKKIKEKIVTKNVSSTSSKSSTQKTSKASATPSSLVSISNLTTNVVPNKLVKIKDIIVEKHVPTSNIAKNLTKILEEAEEKLIVKALRSKQSNQDKENENFLLLNKDQIAQVDSYDDLSHALTTSISELSTPIINWPNNSGSSDSSPESLIGTLCKVYWDGEGQWFYARIVNYDISKKKHFLFYISDHTGEWIDLESEPIVYFNSISIANLGGKQIPVLTFKLTEKATYLYHNEPGYDPDYLYYESFSIDMKPQYKGFIAPEELSQFNMEGSEFNQSKSQKNSPLQLARKEYYLISNTQEQVKSHMPNVLFKYYKGEDWIDVRVRAKGSKIKLKNRRSSNSATSSSCYCSGKILYYLPSSGEYFIVFDDSLVEPQWIQNLKGKVEILLDQPVERKIEIDPATIYCELCKYPCYTESDLETYTINLINEITMDENNNVSIFNIEELDQLNQFLIETENNFNFSNLPDNLRQIIFNNFLKINSLFKCSDCDLHAHKYCLPKSNFQPWFFTTKSILSSSNFGSKMLIDYFTQNVEFNSSIQFNSISSNNTSTSSSSIIAVYNPSKCWKCDKCHCCGCDSLSNQLMWWFPYNIISPGQSLPEEISNVTNDSNYIITSDGIHHILLCGLCLNRYKNKKDYCNICLKVHNNSLCNLEDEKVQDASLTLLQCGQCKGFVHSDCEKMNPRQVQSLNEGEHPLWGSQYLCPPCRKPVCSAYITSIEELDVSNLFAFPVTEEDAMGYFDVIRHPMDISTMKDKLNNGHYKAVQTVRNDVELMVHNALKYNTAGDEYFNIARDFFISTLLLFRDQPHKTKISVHGKEAIEILKQFPIETNHYVSIKKFKPGKNFSSSDFYLWCNGEVKSNEETNIDTTNAVIVSPQSIEATMAKKDDDDISIELVHSIEPKSFFNPFISLTSAEEAYFSYSVDHCVLCGSSGTISSLFNNSFLNKNYDQNEPIYCQVIKKNKKINNMLSEKELSLLLTNSLSYDIISSVESSKINTIRSLQFGKCEILSDENDIKEDDLLNAVGNPFLYCIDCGEAFHFYCTFNSSNSLLLAVKRLLLNQSSKSFQHWRCLNCKICEYCLKPTSDDDNLVLCEGCDLSFHRSCIYPKIDLENNIIYDDLPLNIQLQYYRNIKKENFSSGIEDNLPELPPFFCEKCISCQTCQIGLNNGKSGGNCSFSKNGMKWGPSENSCARCSSIGLYTPPPLQDKFSKDVIIKNPSLVFSYNLNSNIVSEKDQVNEFLNYNPLSKNLNSEKCLVCSKKFFKEDALVEIQTNITTNEEITKCYFCNSFVHLSCTLITPSLYISKLKNITSKTIDNCLCLSCYYLSKDDLLFSTSLEEFDSLNLAKSNTKNKGKSQGSNSTIMNNSYNIEKHSKPFFSFINPIISQNSFNAKYYYKKHINYYFKNHITPSDSKNNNINEKVFLLTSRISRIQRVLKTSQLSKKKKEMEAIENINNTLNNQGTSTFYIMMITWAICRCLSLQKLQSENTAYPQSVEDIMKNVYFSDQLSYIHNEHYWLMPRARRFLALLRRSVHLSNNKNEKINSNLEDKNIPGKCFNNSFLLNTFNLMSLNMDSLVRLAVGASSFTFLSERQGILKPIVEDKLNSVTPHSQAIEFLVTLIQIVIMKIEIENDPSNEISVAYLRSIIVQSFEILKIPSYLYLPVLGISSSKQNKIDTKLNLEINDDVLFLKEDINDFYTFLNYAIKLFPQLNSIEFDKVKESIKKIFPISEDYSVEDERASTVSVPKKLFESRKKLLQSSYSLSYSDQNIESNSVDLTSENKKIIIPKTSKLNLLELEQLARQLKVNKFENNDPKEKGTSLPLPNESSGNINNTVTNLNNEVLQCNSSSDKVLSELKYSNYQESFTLITSKVEKLSQDVFSNLHKEFFIDLPKNYLNELEQKVNVAENEYNKLLEYSKSLIGEDNNLDSSQTNTLNVVQTEINEVVESSNIESIIKEEELSKVQSEINSIEGTLDNLNSTLKENQVIENVNDSNNNLEESIMLDNAENSEENKYYTFTINDEVYKLPLENTNIPNEIINLCSNYILKKMKHSDLGRFSGLALSDDEDEDEIEEDNIDENLEENPEDKLIEQDVEEINSDLLVTKRKNSDDYYELNPLKKAKIYSRSIASNVYYPYPLKGWNVLAKNSQDLTSIGDWVDTRSCVFCHNYEETDFLGRFLPFSDGQFAHANCLLWCHEVEEVGGVLKNAHEARKINISKVCYVCHKRGASLQCHIDTHYNNKGKKCKRSYHLACAMLVGSYFFKIENTKDKDYENKKNITMFCPLHLSQISSVNLQPYIPSDPLKFLVCEQHEGEELNSQIASFLSLGRGRASISGSLTLLNIGNVVMESTNSKDQIGYIKDNEGMIHVVSGSNGFHDTNFIYPLHYKSSRIYWSMKNPMSRTVYLFEIISCEDLDSYNSSIIDYIGEMLHTSVTFLIKYKEELKSNLENSEEAKNIFNNFVFSSTNDSQLLNVFNGPIFKVISLDNPSSPLFSKNIEYLYYLIMKGVEDCNSDLWKNSFNIENKSTQKEFKVLNLFTHRNSRFFNSPVYGLTPHQFFGLTIPFIKYSIEKIPESISCMLTPNSLRYKPSYYNPSYESIKTAIENLEMISNTGGLNFNNRSSLTSGSSRSSSYGVRGDTPTLPKINRVLTKGVESTEEEKTEKSKKKVNIEDDFCTEVQLQEEDQINEELQQALNSQRLREMTRGYLRNPNNRLEVRPSSIHGGGLFSKSLIPKDDVIIEYIGEIIRQAEADYRETLYETEGIGSCYLFRLDKDKIIDATRTGAMARFINHCCEPNAYASVTECEAYPGGPMRKHIAILAAKDIIEGEEVTYDYKFPIEDVKLKCYCGAPRCSGSMN